MSPATRITYWLPSAKRTSLPISLSSGLQWGIIIGLCLLAAGVLAQIEGSDRGVAPIDSSGTYEVSGIAINETADNADDARMMGWRDAQRIGWQQLWQKVHGGAAPVLSDDSLNALVGAIVIEDEQISEHRYIAHLGVLFDRVRASEVLGVSGSVTRSAPMLVIPVMWSGGTGQVFEARTEWQKAWARFRAGNSPINYVRVSGTGADPLLLNAAQVDRRGRGWWRMLLDQYGAADVIIPQVRLEHLWPGGPVIGHFTARYGTDNVIVGSFDLRVESSSNIPRLMDAGVTRMDSLYVSALNQGRLRPDSSLMIETPDVLQELGNQTANTPLANEIGTLPDAGNAAAPVSNKDSGKVSGKAQHFTIQFDTPEAADVSSIEAGVRRVPGVKSLNTSSIAIGGTSLMSVEFDGDIGTLRIGLAARGYHVEEGGGGLRISRGHASAPQ